MVARYPKDCSDAWTLLTGWASVALATGIVLCSRQCRMVSPSLSCCLNICSTKCEKMRLMSLCMCSIAAGMVYPAYASCKALDGGPSTEKSHWLAYWIAFGGVSAVEAFLTQRFPGYYHLKLLLLLWLQSKRYQGAWRLYIEFIRPLYRKLKPKTDAALTQAASVLVSPHLRFPERAHTCKARNTQLDIERTNARAAGVSCVAYPLRWGGQAVMTLSQPHCV